MVYALVSGECVYEHLFETGPNYVVQVGLELIMILHLPLPLRCQECRCVPSIRPDSLFVGASCLWFVLNPPLNPCL